MMYYEIGQFLSQKVNAGEYGDGVILMCNGEEIKAYKKIICNGNRYLYRETISENMKKAQEDLDKIYEALKNNKRFVEI